MSINLTEDSIAILERYSLKITKVTDGGMDNHVSIFMSDETDHVWVAKGVYPPYKPIRIIESTIHSLDAS